MPAEQRNLCSSAVYSEVPGGQIEVAVDLKDIDSGLTILKYLAEHGIQKDRLPPAGELAPLNLSQRERLQLLGEKYRAHVCFAGGRTVICIWSKSTQPLHSVGNGTGFALRPIGDRKW
jgi:hypothetical protein